LEPLSQFPNLSWLQFRERIVIPGIPHRQHSSEPRTRI
jgi:hypothetical protein